MNLDGLMPQQQQIATTLDRPLFVSAGAGSGKTFTLTKRILWALSPESGPFAASLDEVMAITFTKDAAAEIRERVRAALVEEGMDDEALRVDDAWISTIHGMCSRILRAHALQIGLDPEFGVIEGPAVSALMGRAVDDTLSELGDAHALLSWYPLVSEGGFGNSVSVTDIVRSLLEKASALPGGIDDVEFMIGRVDLSGVADAYRLCLGASKGAREVAERALAAIQSFEEGPRTLDDLIVCMDACRAPRASKAFPKDQVALLKGEVADAFINAYLACGGEVAHQLKELAARVLARYSALKDEASVLDNNDLLRRTYLALSEHADIRAQYEHRFKMVMIDEFQDTDQQQVDLINFLTGEGGRALCTVGDAQQSIYRFRGAEVEVFRRAQQRISAGNGAGEVVELVKNFRSHAEILDYVARVFDDAQGGIMPQFLNLLPNEGRRDGLVADVSRRQAIFVSGGTGDVRIEALAAQIAQRFREIADAGQPVGDMVLLLGKMSHADVYARAFREQGLDCVISGGSVFGETVEARTIAALLATLADRADTQNGLFPLLVSPMFALGAQELLALATTVDERSGAVRRRNIDRGLAQGVDVERFGELPLLERAGEILRRAFIRVGRDPISRIASEVVRESGWLVRLERRGAEGRAVAANILKALDAVEQAERECGSAPRAIHAAYLDFLAGKQAPGALNEAAGSAVRIMTVHASKGLEFPVVAVAECYGVRSATDRVRMRRDADGLKVVALPQRFPSVRTESGRTVESADVTKAFKSYISGSGSTPAWLTPEIVDDVCASGSAAEAWLEMGSDEARLSLEERARLLYVAMTRAREVCILAMDARADRSGAPTFKDERDLTGRVLDRILPSGRDDLEQDVLVFEGSRPGDFVYRDLADEEGEGEEPRECAAEALAEPGAPDHFTLVYPEDVVSRVHLLSPRARTSYSFSSSYAAEHDKDAEALDSSARERLERAQDCAVRLGSAFHACAQLMVELNVDDLGEERIARVCRRWKLDEEQAARVVSALAWWRESDVRAEVLGWPLVRAEVPFFAVGEEDKRALAENSEGSIDLLATDPADRTRALMVDYKTGGAGHEVSDELRAKYRAQAEVYASALHRMGYLSVACRFVRVEAHDVVSFEL